jgi:hypothetical protein
MVTSLYFNLYVGIYDECLVTFLNIFLLVLAQISGRPKNFAKLASLTQG